MIESCGENPMTTKNENQESPENDSGLFNSEERAIFNQIATMEPPHSWRAQALLAIDEGETQTEAGRQAGLTQGQVRYWLARFRKHRIAIFPEELLNQAKQEDADSSLSSAEPVASPDGQDLEQTTAEKEAQQELPETEGTTGPIDEAAVQNRGTPKAKRKPKKKPKKTKKSKKVKNPKRDKKRKKGKKSKKKKSKKKGSKEAKRAKGRSTKRSKKKSNN
jgi:hypothetical protein